jgi:hypothetical protein
MIKTPNDHILQVSISVDANPKPFRGSRIPRPNPAGMNPEITWIVIKSGFFDQFPLSEQVLCLSEKCLISFPGKAFFE